jgi:hypothetical protein
VWREQSWKSDTRADGEQPPPEVGVFTVELDRDVESADALQGVPPDREVDAGVTQGSR